MRGLKDEGLIFSILKCLSLQEARRLWNVQRRFFKVLDSKVIPLLALYEREWNVVSHFMQCPIGCTEGHPRFEYNYDNVCIEAVLHHDYEGLMLLSRCGYDFKAIRRDPRMHRFTREALQEGSSEKLFMLRSIDFDYGEILSDCIARGELANSLLLNRSITVDFLGIRMAYQCSALEFASTDYVERQLASLCGSRDGLFRVPFIMAAFIKAGASPSCFMRPDGCWYLLLLALASESFNFVYLLVKEAVHIDAIFQRHNGPFLTLVHKALQQRRFFVLELLAFCGFRLGREEGVQQQFDQLVLTSGQEEDFLPVECLWAIGYSLQGFAERCQVEFQEFIQSRLEEPQLGQLLCDGEGNRQDQLGPRYAGVHPAIKRLAALDRHVLEPHFRSREFLDFVDGLLGKRAFVALRQIVEVCPNAFEAYFQEHYGALEALLFDAFLLRDIALIVDLSSLSFPLAPFFARRQAEVDGVLLNTWLPNKCWTELVMLKNEVRQWSFPTFFERNCERSDAFVLGIIENGYWFDLHNLVQLAFDFPSFFHRCFAAVSQAVLQFIAAPHPHFVLLRELSALNFPWTRFMEVHREQIVPSKHHDFLQFVISVNGFELGSKVYDVVEETCRLYHSMAASMFNSSSSSPDTATGAATGDHADDASRGKEQEKLARHGEREVLQNTRRPATVRLRAALKRVRPHRESEGEASSATGGSSSSSSASSCSAAGASPSSSSERSSSQDSALLPELATGRMLEEAQLSTRSKAKELLRKVQQKKLETKKVLMLMLCKGAYCWNPLKVDPEKGSSGSSSSEESLPVSAKENSSWADIEGVVNFLESREDMQILHGSLAALVHHLPPPPPPPPGVALYAGAAQPGAAFAVPQAPAGAPPPAPAAGLPPPIGAPQPLLLLQGLQLPALPQQAGAAQNTASQLVFHIICLPGRGEERTFTPKIELFWQDVLEPYLPTRTSGG